MKLVQKIGQTTSMKDVLACDQRKRRSPSLESLATMLSLSVGIKSITQSAISRWAPTAGNFGSCEAYVIVKKLQGIAPGVFFYLPEQHALARLNLIGHEHLRQATEAIASNVDDDILVVLTGAYKRVAHKYGTFAYKLLHFDAGVATSQMFMVARALCVPIESAGHWQPLSVGNALALRTGDDVITNICCLSGTRPRSRYKPRTIGSTPHLANAEGLDSIDLSDPLAAELLVQSLIGRRTYVNEVFPRYLYTTMLGKRDLSHKASDTYDGNGGLGRVLAQRSSVRHFSNKCLRLQDIQKLFSVSLANGVLVSTQLQITIVVQRCEDINPGVYQYNVNTLRLDCLRSSIESAQVDQLFLQEGFHDTPLIAVISGTLSGDARDYEAMLTQAGFLGHRLWMAGLGLGLSGTLIAGLRQGLHSLTDTLSANDVALLAFVGGYEKGGTPNDGSHVHD